MILESELALCRELLKLRSNVHVVDTLFDMQYGLLVHSTKIISGMVESVGDTAKCSHPAMVKLRTHHATIRTLPIIHRCDFKRL